MSLRVVGRLGLADAVTVANAALGFLATAAAAADPGVAARLILLAAIADALDGVIARRRGGTPAGPYLDSLADVASFGVAPAALVAAVAAASWDDRLAVGAALAAGAAYVAMAVARLGLYTAYDTDADETEGVQTTLAATVLAAAVLSKGTRIVVEVPLADPGVLVPLAALLAALMVSEVTYPDLHAQDAVVMGVVQALAVAVPGFWGRVFAFALLFLTAAYILLGPGYYWRDGLSPFGS